VTGHQNEDKKGGKKKAIPNAPQKKGKVEKKAMRESEAAERARGKKKARANTTREKKVPRRMKMT